MHYVYRHIRLDKNTPFYIGKGGYADRAYDVHGRNSYWKNIANKYGYKIEIVKKFRTNKAALDYEKKLVYLYKKFGYCEANLADGGAGRPGLVLSEKQKNAISNANKGPNNGMWMKRGSLNPSYGSGEAIFCFNNSKVYISSEAAQNDLGIKNVIKVVKGLREQAGGYYFSAIDFNLRTRANRLRKERYTKCKRKKKSTLFELKQFYGIKGL